MMAWAYVMISLYALERYVLLQTVGNPEGALLGRGLQRQLNEEREVSCVRIPCWVCITCVCVQVFCVHVREYIVAEAHTLYLCMNTNRACHTKAEAREAAYRCHEANGAC
jgi:hypothetical protein